MKQKPKRDAVCRICEKLIKAGTEVQMLRFRVPGKLSTKFWFHPECLRKEIES